ncbi:MAG: putative O-glycosylation ligase, exosortase A system-associated [Pseudomonadota bacterium]
MRDLLFVMIFLPMPVICFLRPWIGLLIWAWFASTFPMSHLWGFATTLPGNMVVTAATLLGWLVAKDEAKSPPGDRTNLLFMALALVTSISILLSRAPDYTAIKTTEYLSIFLYLILLSMFLRTTERFHAFIWMIAFSFAYFAVKCSASVIVTAGAHKCVGPSGTIISDRNHFALACLIVIPLLNYLRLQARHHWVSLTLFFTMMLTCLAVVGTHSRGGFIGLVCLLAYFWWNAGRKIGYLIVMAAGLVVVFHTASDSWLSRMQSIETASEDDRSFQGRLYAWGIYYRAALDRPLIGVGPKALESRAVVANYLEVQTDQVKALAAHSIYFQVMGELGFVALGIYIALLYTGWANGRWIARRTRDHPALAWAGDLARMCQISIVVFAIAGAALSMAIFDLLLSILIVLAALRRFVAHRLKSVQESTAPPLADAAPAASP